MKVNGTLGVVAIASSFIFTYLLGFLVLPILKKLKAGQTTKDIGPVWHKPKTGTPTMGGIFLILGVCMAIMASLFLMHTLKGALNLNFLALKKADMVRLYAGLFCALGLGVIGFMDDYIKIIHKHNKGLSALQKTTFQLTVIISYFLTLFLNGCISEVVSIPLIGQVNFGFYYYIISVLGMYGIVNAVNLTDGLDGLVSSVTAIYAMIFIIITNLLSSIGMNILACSLFGSCLGFLIWNFYPAKVFMGDTGSMFLGGLVASLGFGLNEPVLILIVGVIYVVEAMSVVIQVVYFKLTGGKRIFKMSPIHHHFEMSGYSEIKIMILFCIITTIFGYLGIIIIKSII